MNGKFFRNGIVMLILVVGTVALLYTWLLQTPTQDSRGYSQFLSDVQQNKVTKVVQQDQSLTVNETDGKAYQVSVPTVLTDVLADMKTAATSSGVSLASDVYSSEKPPDTSWLGLVLTGLLPLLLIGGFIFFMMRQAQGTNNQALSFGKSRARMFLGNKTVVTFNDVAGVDEAKTELQEVVEFLKYPEKFNSLGARIPRGVLLVGPPGTGKTLMARAVAGEAGVPFFSISGSEFVEMFVGVGASRVRDLFDQAKRNSPCIVFVDEIDAVGRQRGAGLGGSNDEREQTLDQILTELDGFESSEAVVVLAATNRPDVLDSALLRPGRFDRRVTVQAPDRKGRKEILEVHTRSIPLAGSVDLDALAASTPGMVGADLANLANEAALLAARREHEKVQMADFTDSLEKLMLGSPRGILLSPADRERTAYHESGHALVGMLTPGADPVRKVSIIPRGMALGVTLSTPDADRVSYSLEDLQAKIRVALGGRVAEEIVYGTITTGAESDIQQLTLIARQMVGRWGMSEAIGPIAVLPADGEGPFLPGVSATSESTQRLLDDEVRRMVDAAHREVTRLLTDHRAQLESLAQALLGAETLDALDAYAAAGVPGHDTEPTPVSQSLTAKATETAPS